MKQGYIDAENAALKVLIIIIIIIIIKWQVVGRTQLLSTRVDVIWNGVALASMPASRLACAAERRAQQFI